MTTRLGETRVLFGGLTAPIAYTVSGEVMAVVPYEVSNRKTTDVVVEYQGKRSPAVTLDVVASTPALFTLDSSGKGQAAILNETGCCNSARNPAARGARDGWWRARSDRLCRGGAACRRRPASGELSGAC